MKLKRGAFLTSLLVTAWSLFSTFFHMTRPVDVDHVGVTVLIGVSLIGVILIPFYLREKGWVYLAGVFLNMGIITAGVNTVLNKEYFFSMSIYNVSVVIIYIFSFTGLILNLLSFKRMNKPSLRKALVTSISILVLFSSVMYPIYASYSKISEFRAIQIQSRVNTELENHKTIHDKIGFLVEEGDIPSLVVGIVVDDQLVYADSFGEASVDTAYSCGSVTKMFTATAVMQLYETGGIELDTDVSNYLPFKVQHPLYPDTMITVRNLLSHQSGLNHLTIVEEAYYRNESQINWLSNKHGWDINPIEPYPTLTEYLVGLIIPGGQYYTERVWSVVEPGTEHIYSNTNYVILSAIIEQVSGMSFSDYVQENVFDPSEMGNSVFDYSEVNGEYATGYEREFGVLSKTNLVVPDYSYLSGSGGMITTVEDLSKFMINQLNKEENALLSKETISMMHEKTVDGGGHVNKVGYGLGFTHLSESAWQYYDEYYGLDGAIGHEGGQIGYVGSFYFMEKKEGGYGIILLSNLSTIENGIDFNWYFPIFYKIQTLLMGEAKLLHSQTSNTE